MGRFDRAAPRAKSASNTDEESMGLHRYMNDNEIRMIAQIPGPIDYSPAQLSKRRNSRESPTFSF